MPKKNLTEIICVIDKSGSMSDLAEDAKGGYNQFLRNQKESGDEIVISTVLFDAELSILYSGIHISDAAELDSKTYIPGGMTALYDAVGRGIDDTDLRHANLAEKDLSEKVIFVILTDGQENSSQFYNARMIKEKIEIHKKRFNWEFVFLAANQDAILAGAEIGIYHDKCVDFSADSHGVSSSFDMVNEALNYVKKGMDMSKWKKEMLEKEENEKRNR